MISFDQSNNTSAIDVKMDLSVLEEKPSFKMLGLTLTLIGAPIGALIGKLEP